MITIIKKRYLRAACLNCERSMHDRSNMKVRQNNGTNNYKVDMRSGKNDIHDVWRAEYGEITFAGGCSPVGSLKVTSVNNHKNKLISSLMSVNDQTLIGGGVGWWAGCFIIHRSGDLYLKHEKTKNRTWSLAPAEAGDESWEMFFDGSSRHRVAHSLAWGSRCGRRQCLEGPEKQTSVTLGPVVLVLLPLADSSGNRPYSHIARLV